MIIEEAIVAQLLTQFEDLPIYAVDWPEAKPAPCLVYRQTGSQSEAGHYVTTNIDTFQFLIVGSPGRDTQRYRETKDLASQVAQAFGTDFTIAGDEPFCVHNVERGSQLDQYDRSIPQHWVESAFTFTYYTEE